MPFATRTQVFGKQFVELPSATSTNTVAAELLATSRIDHGAVVLAHEQTAGKGQRGRTWLSHAGLDLTFSMVLKPKGLRTDDQFTLGKLAALAVCDVVEAIVPAPVRIKWPNDILVERRKVAGMLIRTELLGGTVQSAILGIGLNVNSSGFEEELAATSLSMETGREHDRFTLLADLCLRLEERWHQWEQGSTAWVEDYARKLWTRGRWADLVLDGLPLSARPMDVDATGRLIVEHEDGSVQAYGLERLRFAPR